LIGCCERHLHLDDTAAQSRGRCDLSRIALLPLVSQPPERDTLIS
jgi:hypothetical protein